MINLFRPWSYLWIYPVDWTIRFINYLLPAILASLVIFVTYHFDPVGTNIFVADSALIKIGEFIQTLPGFYVAALSAIATFDKQDLDAYLLGKPLYLKSHNGDNTRLTRRRFLCVMFAYLTVQSVIFSLLCISISSINIPLFCFFGMTQLPFVVAWIVYFILFQLLTITLVGIFYLGEKIHIPNP